MATATVNYAHWSTGRRTHSPNHSFAIYSIFYFGSQVPHDDLTLDFIEPKRHSLTVWFTTNADEGMKRIPERIRVADWMSLRFMWWAIQPGLSLHALAAIHFSLSWVVIHLIDIIAYARQKCFSQPSKCCQIYRDVSHVYGISIPLLKYTPPPPHTIRWKPSAPLCAFHKNQNQERISWWN